MFTFFVFSTGWNIAKAKILQGADFGCPLVVCLPGDGAHGKQKNAKVSERGKGVVLHGRVSERRSHQERKAMTTGHALHNLFYFSYMVRLISLCELATAALTSQARRLFQTKH